MLVCHVKYVKLYHVLFKTTYFQLLISIKSSIRATSRRPSDRVRSGSHDTLTKRKTRPTVQEKSCGNTYNPSYKLPVSYTHTSTQSKQGIFCFVSNYTCRLERHFFSLLLKITKRFSGDFVRMSLRREQKTVQLLNCFTLDF